MTRFASSGLRNRRAVPFAAVPLEADRRFPRDSGECSACGLAPAGALRPARRMTRTRVSLRFSPTMTKVSWARPAPLYARGLSRAHSATVRRHTRSSARSPSSAPLIPEGHPWLKPLRRHLPDHRASAAPASCSIRQKKRTRSSACKGEEVHEVAVGPVHAGIIEPGHFRFQAHGEEVLFLEIMLGYQHRGVECLLETLAACSRSAGGRVDRGRHRHRTRRCLLQRHRSTGTQPQDAACAKHSRHCARARAAGQPHRRPGRDCQRRCFPAGRRLLRPACEVSA